ncbi:MAG: hypothetical protein QHH26_12115 [Armatimonadota bacterium]|nr:hypothetical protein [Armatimonadota bacterium]
MAWLLLHYQPTTLFSLKSSIATSTVGRSLVIPTPYAIKMAFVDAAFRAGWEESKCRQLVEDLAKVWVRIKPAVESVVTQTIQKIRQEGKDRESENPYISSIAYREVVYVQGHWIWALNLQDNSELANDILCLAPFVHYIGKRGSMLQFVQSEWAESLGSEFTLPVTESLGEKLAERSRIIPLDDFGPKAKFEYLNSYEQKFKPKLGEHRIRVDTLVPVTISNCGPGFVQYSAQFAQ